MNIINTKQLTKLYGSTRGISNVSLQVQEGEIFGFIGPNGAGKSTTIRVLLGLLRPTSGSATIFDKDIARHGPEIRMQIGYLPSEVFYYDNMRAGELLRYSGSFYDKDPDIMKKRIEQLAHELDLDLHKKIDDLSFGNKKKVGIIQSLLHEPKLIILDEPTSGLDPLMQQKFLDLLKKENARGATVLLSSHNLIEVQKVCDRVAIIKEGQIIHTEKMSDLTNNIYKRVRLESLEKVAKAYFSGLGGIRNVSIRDKEIAFLYKGKINDLTKKVAGLNLKNLTIEEPDLEEVFMHFYQKEG